MKTLLKQLFMATLFVAFLSKVAHFNLFVATGFTTLLYIHEMGHYSAARWLGIKVTTPLLIPGLGAIMVIKESNFTATEEVIIGAAGPLAGIGATLITMLFSCLFFPENENLKEIMGLSFTVNLLNLLPIRPFDGGRILQAVGKWTRYMGIAILLWFFRPMFPFSLILSTFVLMEFGNSYHHTNMKSKLFSLGIYILLATLGIIGLGFTQ